MKTFVKIFLLIVALMVIASMLFAAPEPSQHSKKQTAALVGLDKVKQPVLAFYDLPYGSYTIRVSSDNTKTDFKHTKIQESAIIN